MDDLISRQAAIDAIRAISDHGDSARANALGLAEHAVENLQPVQPKHGKWLPDNNNPYEMRFVCSQCKTSERVPTMMYEPIWDYCPHCGADMKCSENPNS